MCFCTTEKVVNDVKDQHDEAVEIFTESISDRDCQISVSKSCKCIVRFIKIDMLMILRSYIVY